MLKTKTKLSKSKLGRTMYLTVPQETVTDSQFPFPREGCDVILEIDVGNKRLIVTVVEK